MRRRGRRPADVGYGDRRGRRRRVEEQAEQALSTVDSEFGRTNDPVRMYMREMGTVELLTREGEIEIAKRIEDGLKHMVQAISACPTTIANIIGWRTKVEADEMRIDELVDGLNRPQRDGGPPRNRAASPDDRRRTATKTTKTAMAKRRRRGSDRCCSSKNDALERFATIAAWFRKGCEVARRQRAAGQDGQEAAGFRRVDEHPLHRARSNALCDRCASMVDRSAAGTQRFSNLRRTRSRCRA